MKIAQVTAYWGPDYPSGSGVSCYELSKRLAENFEVHVFTSSTGEINNGETPDNLHVHRLKTYAAIWDMNPVADVFTQLLRNDFDIVHVHSYIFFMSNMAALASIFKRQFKYILHFRGGLDFTGNTQNFHPGRIWAKEKIYDKTLGYFTTKLADKVLSVSKSDIPIIKSKFGIKEVEWMPNAVDTKKFISANGRLKSPVVTYVGKLEKWKGIDTLIKSFEIINKQVKDVRFVIAGTGSLESELRQADLPIELLGAVTYEKMVEVYQEASAVILPSYMEGFPVTCVEALSCEVPVVATDVGDVRETIIDGVTGFVTQPGDYTTIASRVVKMLEDEDLRRKLGRSGRAHVEKNFSYETLTARILREYEDCLKS
jgi:glycosyltransferase involved in cell wall biosynthesis